MNATPDKMNILNSFRLCLLLWIWLGIALPCFAQFGQVDPDFLVKRPTNGRYVADGQLIDIQCTNDNKLLVLGDFNNIDGHITTAVAKFNADGTIDTSYHTSLLWAQRMIPGQMYQYPDGRILLLGSFGIQNTPQINGKIIRLQADGSIDSSFNINPIKTVLDRVICFSVINNGSILVGGSFITTNQNKSHLVLLDPNGNLIDKNYHVNGPVTAITPLGGDQFLFGGNFDVFQNQAYGQVVKASSDGVIDTSFKGPVLGGTIRTIKVIQDSIIWVGGSNLKVAPNTTKSLLKLDFTGKIDPDFNVSTTAFIKKYSEVSKIVQKSENEYYLLGDFDSVNGVHVVNACRITTSGNVLSSENESFNLPTGMTTKGNVLYTTDHFGAINKYVDNVKDTTFFYPIYPVYNNISEIEVQSNDDMLVTSFNNPQMLRKPHGYYRIKPNGQISVLPVPFVDFESGKTDHLKKFENDGFGVYSYKPDAVQFIRYDKDGIIQCKKILSTKGIVGQAVMHNNSYLMGEYGEIFIADEFCDTTQLKIYQDIDYWPTRIKFLEPFIYVLYHSFSLSVQRFSDQMVKQGNSIHIRKNYDKPEVNFFKFGSDVYISNVEPDNDTIDYLYRYKVNGTIDSTFKKIPKTYAIAQHNDYLLVGGAFTEIQGKPYKGFARLHMDGTVDTTYIQHGGCNGTVRDIKVLSNGDIIVAGEFTEFDGYACNNIVKLSGQPNATYEPLGYTDEYTLYPNPATNQLTIQGNNQQSFSVNIYDSLGRLWMQSGKSNGQTLTIAIDQLPPMIYFVQSRADGKMIGKFVKR